MSDTRRAAPHALIVGGSVGGLFAARLLMHAGWQVTVFERSAANLAGRGAGVGITRELLEALAAAGAEIEQDIGVTVRSFRWLDHAGDCVLEHPRAMGSSAWVRIYKALRHGFPDGLYRNGVDVARVADHGDRVEATLRDGSTVSGDLLVAADGSGSGIRQMLLPGVEARPAGYIAWRGVAAAADVERAARQEIDGHIVFSFAGGEMMLTMPVPAADAGEAAGRYYFIWYRRVPDGAAMADLFTDGEGRQHGQNIPPPLIRPELIAGMRADAAATVSPAAAAVVGAAAQPMLQAISDLACPTLAFGRIALLGDAAFVARPHVAGGITKAAMDARALVDALAAGADVPEALVAYSGRQVAFGQALVDHARFLGGPFERTPPAEAPDPAAILAAYGAPHLLTDPDPESFAATKA